MRTTNAGCCRLLLRAGARVDALDGVVGGVLPNIAWWARRRQEFGWLRSVIDERYDRNLAEVFRLIIAAGAERRVPVGDSDSAIGYLTELELPEAKRVLRG